MHPLLKKIVVAPLFNATEKYNQNVLHEEKNFCCYYHCNSYVVDMKKIQIKSILNKYRGWTYRINTSGTIHTADQLTQLTVP